MILAPHIADYIIARRGRFFPGWPREQIEEYASFHLEQGTMVTALDDYWQVCGLLCGWQQDAPHLAKWDWQKTDSAGRYWWFDHFFAENADIAMQLALGYIGFWPMCDLLPCVGERNGKVRIYPPGAALKIFQKAMRLYGHFR